jgi:hypothetical protein
LCWTFIYKINVRECCVRCVVTPIVKKIVETRLRWLGRVERRPVEGSQTARKIIRVTIKNDLEANEFDRNMIYGRIL